MGIGRRDFLAAFGILLTRLSTCPSPAAAVHEDVYLNRRLGISFPSPPDWEFIQLEQMGEVQKGQLLAINSAEDSESLLANLGRTPCIRVLTL